MPTRPSQSAVALAEQLTTDGFENVSPVLVQRWRELGLLGAWQHSHPGGPGSAAVPAPGAYGRARLLARLRGPHRNHVTVSLLACLTGLPIEAAEVREAIHMLFAPTLTALCSSLDDEPIDRADELVRGLVARRRSRDQIRRLSAKLNDARDPQWQPDAVPRSAEQRTTDVVTALLAAAGGDSSWIAVVLADALRLQDMDDVVVAAELDDPSVVAEATEMFETTLDSLFGGLGRLDELSDHDVDLSQQTAAAWFVQPSIAEFAESPSPIIGPDKLIPLIVGPLLSQLAMPGQLHGQIMLLRGSIDPDPRMH